jgi:hypothetical protein
MTLLKRLNSSGSRLDFRRWICVYVREGNANSIIKRALELFRVRVKA